MGDQSHIEVDTIGLERWGREAALVGDDLSAALYRSGQLIALCGNGFGVLSSVEFDAFVATLDTRKGKLMGSLNGLAVGLTGAAASYGSVDNRAAETMDRSTARLRL